MIAKLLQACVFFQPAQIACWEVLLRESGFAREVPEPAIRRAMHRALRSVWHLAGGNATECELTASRLGPSEFADSRCGREALQAFLASGGRAIGLVFAEIERAYPECSEKARRQMRRRIAAALASLGRVELEVLCRGCPLLTPDCVRREARRPERRRVDARPQPRSSHRSCASASAPEARRKK